MKLQVIIFASKDDPDGGWEKAQKLSGELEALRVDRRLVNKLGFDLEALKLVARHRIVNTPSVVIARGGRTLFKTRGFLPACTLKEQFSRLLKD